MASKRVESVAVRFTKEERRALERLAAKEQRTLSDLLRVLARKAVAAQGVTT